MGASTSQLSTSTSQSHDGSLCEMVRNILPPLDHTRHKGQAGRIGIIGGCQEYTGAPYFAGISALKVGADLSHIFCTRDAATVIKSYSPELIVHPVLDDQKALSEISDWLPRLHALVIGPGLGRDVNPNVIKTIINLAKGRHMPIVIDADGLYYVCQNASMIHNYPAAILTPNVVEFSRLHQVVLHKPAPEDSEHTIASVTALSQALGNVTLVHKGDRDIISNGALVLIVDSEGSPRRCGGQGDLLSGSMGAFAHWTSMAFNNKLPNETLKGYGPSMCAAYGACLLTRECSRLAFQYYRRSMMTTNMIEEIQRASENLFG